MDKPLYQYEINPTTWVYVSSIATIALFFKFSRFWSVRNLDLIGLLALAPGLLMVSQGQKLEDLAAERNGRSPPAATFSASAAMSAGGDVDKPVNLQAARSLKRLGFGWLFVVGVFFLIRLLGDPLLVRRPLLEPNLAPGGLTFVVIALYFFLMAHLLMTPVPTVNGEGSAEAAVASSSTDEPAGMRRRQPEFSLLSALPNIPSRAFPYRSAPRDKYVHAITSKTLSVLAHLAIVAGLVFIGYRHFENVWTGLAMAGLYLLLPYTAQMLGRVDHVIPAAVLVWSIASYRRPLIVGLLIGLVAGLIYYPVFLLPLWIGFYWKRGLGRFLLGVAASGTTLVVLVLMFSTNVGVILDHMKLWLEDAEGFWEAHDEVYRLPILALFSVLCVSMAIWPTQKNLGTLISCSAAVMLGVQFWSMAGMLYVNWYLPLLLMTVYRPNLDHRVAIAAVSERWFHWRRGIKQQAA